MMLFAIVKVPRVKHAAPRVGEIARHGTAHQAEITIAVYPATAAPRKSYSSGHGGLLQCQIPVLPTANRRNPGAALSRLIVLPFPSIVIALLITGSPVGP